MLQVHCPWFEASIFLTSGTKKGQTLMKQEFIEDNLLILSKQTFELFLRVGKTERYSDVLGLYMFYYYTAKWQHTNQPKCTTNFTAEGIGWTRDKVIKNKKVLVRLGLIEDIQDRDEVTGYVKGHYIKLNYIWKKETVESKLSSQRGGLTRGGTLLTQMLKVN